MTPGLNHQFTASRIRGEQGSALNSPRRDRGLIHPGRGVSGPGGIDHRHDAGLDRLRQLGPGSHESGQVGRYYAMSNPVSRKAAGLRSTTRF
jgi:hypothetical protein